MLFLENYHPCHNEDIQKRKKKEIKRIFDLGGVLAGQRYIEVKGFK